MAISLPTKAELLVFKGMISVGDIAHFFGVSQSRLLFHLYSGRRPAYSRFTIRKAAGGSRQIASPPPLIRSMQTKLLRCINGVARPKPSVHGFTHDRSVKTNAKAHLDARWLLNLDLLDFFPSIHFGRVRGVFLRRPFFFPPSVAAVLSHICCFQRILPQGAPTSPAISNLICRGLDRDLARFARADDCRYTRYADDITFSTKNDRFHSDTVLSPSRLQQPMLGDALLHLLSAHGFQPNVGKTRLRGRSERQEVTGVVINEKLNVPRSFVRNLRSILHDCEVRGLSVADTHFRMTIDHKSRLGSPPSLERHTRGKLAYLRMIRGDADDVYLGLAIRAERVLPARKTQGVVIHGAPACEARFLKTAIFIVIGRDAKGNILSEGTAFAMKDIGIATARHVFADAACVSWELRPSFEPSTAYPIRGIRFLTDYDLVVVETPARSFACLRRSNETVAVGDSVTLAGYPAWLTPADSLLISAGRVIQTKTAGGTDYILIDAAIRGGNSGGPLLARNGTVLGVAVYDESSAIAPNGVVAIRHIDSVAGAPTTSVGMV
jgi:RNA-directed DNA polymerase